MIAYYVHDSKKETDMIVLPDMGCSVAVDAERMETFISKTLVRLWPAGMKREMCVW
jgi:hypothetical protein